MIEFRVWDIGTNRMRECEITMDGYVHVWRDERICLGKMDTEGPGKFVYVMQWTGIKDKNGIKIFDGDIVDFPYPTNWKGHKDLHVVEFPADFLWVETQQKEIWVVGNKFQNPGLLARTEEGRVALENKD